jgi:hypothetical protein
MIPGEPTMSLRRSRLLLGRLPGVWLPLFLTVAGCTDLGQAGVLSARKSFRVPLEGVEVNAPLASLAGLVSEEELEAVIAANATPEQRAAWEASGASPYDLGQAAFVVPEDELQEDVEDLLIAELQARIEDEANAAVDGDAIVTFETDFAAWEPWELDLDQPDASIESALFTYPVVYRVTLEADSLDELLSGGQDEGDDAEPGQNELQDLSESELVRALYVRELGLRTLASDEVEPEAGWPDEAAEDAAMGALRDPQALEGCQGDQVPLDQTLTARLVVQSLEDPFLFATLGEVALDGGSEVCGVRVDTDEDANLKPFFQSGIRLTAELRMAMGDLDFHLGGYLVAGVEARASLPGSLDDIGDL